MSKKPKAGLPNAEAKIETDEMKLELLAQAGKNDTEDALYPAELNVHFIEQIRILSTENTELRKCIFGKDQEITEQTKTITDLNQRIRDIISGNGPAISSKSAGVISAKIADLCKTNRHLVAEVESYKTKNAALERKIIQTELYYKDPTNLEQTCSCKKEDIPVEPTPNEFNDMKEKLAAVNKKLFEARNQNIELKNEILLANRMLRKEIGDKFTNIKELVLNSAGFKGRAQQIALLNEKICQLEEKCNMKAKEKSFSLEERRRDQHSQLIRDLESKKKKEINEALQGLERVKIENCELKKKLDGARARIRILECDTTMLKQKIQTLVDKSNHDDLLVNEQSQQMKKLEIHYQEMLRDGTCTINKMREAYGEAQKEIKNFDQKIDALKFQVSEKAAKIEELKRQLQRYEEISLQSVFYTPMKTATDNEIKKLAELIKTQNARMTKLRDEIEELESQNRKIREGKTRLARKVQQLEAENLILKESKMKLRSRSSLLKDSSVIKKSLSALSVRSKNTTLESKMTVNGGSDEIKAEASCICCDNLEKEDLRNKLELANEKLKIMEDKLKMLEEEKVEDLEHLTDMIQTSKALFNDALTVLQKEKCICNVKCCVPH